jgi:hypothetical protein
MPLQWTEGTHTYMASLIRGSKTYGKHLGHAQQKLQQKHSSKFRDNFTIKGEQMYVKHNWVLLFIYYYL